MGSKSCSWFSGARAALTCRLAIAFLFGGFALLHGTAAQGADTVVVPYGSAGYRYSVVGFGAGAGFEKQDFDDSNWKSGGAPFGTKSGFCPIYETVRTTWPVSTDLLLRKLFTLPAGAQAVKVAVAIDNDIQVFVNGVDISFGLEMTDGCAEKDQLLFPIPTSLLVFGGQNQIAVRAHDRGNISFCDLEIRYGLPQAIPPKSLVYLLQSGNSVIGGSDPLIWVQGHSVPLFGVPDAGLPLQQAFVVRPQSSWAAVAGAQWVSPTQSSNAAPEGYEYFTLFALPPGFHSAQLDVIWRADDNAELAVNDIPLPTPWATFSPSTPQGEFHGDILQYLQPGMNRLQFLATNARVGINPTGVSFAARIVLSP
jgi:hypothetical protein